MGKHVGRDLLKKTNGWDKFPLKMTDAQLFLAMGATTGLEAKKAVRQKLVERNWSGV